METAWPWPWMEEIPEMRSSTFEGVESVNRTESSRTVWYSEQPMCIAALTWDIHGAIGVIQSVSGGDVGEDECQTWPFEPERPYTSQATVKQLPSLCT